MLLTYNGTEGEANVLDNSHTRGRTRNQRLPASRALIRTHPVESPLVQKPAGYCFATRCYLSAVPSFMPLTRLNDSAFDAQLEGVYFGMWTGSTSVRCLVTHAALTDKSQGSGQAECLDVF